jgi:hypothetical protein
MVYEGRTGSVNCRYRDGTAFSALSERELRQRRSKRWSQGSRGEAGGGQFGSGSGAAAADKPADKPAKKKGKKIESRDEFVEKGVALRMRTRDAHRASATASPQ